MKNQKGHRDAGQALIELIIFLPLMFTLYSIIGGFASAINGSINQQKATRAYTYYLAQNSSTIPSPKSANDSFRKFGMNVVGWKNKLQGTAPLMPCYKIPSPTKAKPNDECDAQYSEENTQFIRVGTVYGICGATYLRESNHVVMIPDGSTSSFSQAFDVGSCLIE